VDTRTLGLLVVAIGLAVVALGALIAAGALSWFGRLPGDIRIEGDNVRIYVPLASMLLVSIVLSLALALLARLR
jgi:hypothetical protein